MFAIIGIVVTFGAVLGGYLMEHGNVRVLMQPAELLIIGGAGAGTVLIANPLHILKQIAAGGRRSIQGIEVHQAALCRFAETKLRTAEQGAPARTHVARGRC